MAISTSILTENTAGSGAKGKTIPWCRVCSGRSAVATFSVRDYEDEPDYRRFLGCNTEDGYVHRHIDSSPPGKLHVRMNLMLPKPAGGGMPVIDGEEFDIEERDLWCFFPSIMPHESTPVTGDRKRFVVSIGILVPNTMSGSRNPQISN